MTSLTDKVARAFGAQYVPGVMRCAKCKFRLVKANLNMQDGTVSAAAGLEPEACPNGCGPMWPSTWRQEAEENLEIAERLQTQLSDLRVKFAEAEKTAMLAREEVSRLSWALAQVYPAGECLTVPDGSCVGHGCIHDGGSNIAGIKIVNDGGLSSNVTFIKQPKP